VCAMTMITVSCLSSPPAPTELPRSRAPGERIASCAIVVAVAGFLAFIVPAMRAYPGGTTWDNTTRGSDFWLNYLSDLQRSVALNGEPNATGAALAQAAMLLLAVGLAPFWWLAARRFPERPRLGRAVRTSGLAGVVGSIAVGLMPSDRFGDGHSLAVVLGGVPGLVAAGLAVGGLASRGRTARVAAVIGAVTVLVSSADFLLYVERLGQAGLDLPVIAILERVSVIFVLLWMCTIAWHTERGR
jgi:hypothetical protein